VRYIWSLCERTVFGSILAVSLCLAGKAQDQPQTASAQIDEPISQGEALSASARAPSSAKDDNTWHFQSLGYLWFPGMHGTIGACSYETSVY
jgi:hypothetical protein